MEVKDWLWAAKRRIVSLCCLNRRVSCPLMGVFDGYFQQRQRNRLIWGMKNRHTMSNKARFEGLQKEQICNAFGKRRDGGLELIRLAASPPYLTLET